MSFANKKKISFSLCFPLVKEKRDKQSLFPSRAGLHMQRKKGMRPATRPFVAHLGFRTTKKAEMFVGRNGANNR